MNNLGTEGLSLRGVPYILRRMNAWDEDEAFAAAAAPIPLSQRAMAGRGAPYLDDLNPAQRAAVEALDGPVLMLAGAGTGKTKALTCADRASSAPAAGPPERDSGGDLHQQGRARDEGPRGPLAGRGGRGDALDGHLPLAVGQDPAAACGTGGAEADFTILDTDDQIRLLKQLISAANIDEKRWPARLLASLIDGWKNRALTPDRVPSSDAGAYNNRGTELYEAYQERLKTLNAVDFGDLLLHCVTIFQKHPDVLEQYQRWFRYILVDEYQDTNVAQYLWLRLLAQSHKNICCVGDDDQSIYGWRGAEVGNILRFEKDFPARR
jgi:DNA helicase II / ATP-dependent DNA helicase PcrA